MNSERSGAAAAYTRTLSLRLTNDDYRALRRFAAAAEERTGARLTHQRILERALSEYLDQHAAPIGDQR